MSNEVMMIPTQEFERLQDFYKGQITQSALLNKAGRLAAEKHLILKNRKIPDALAVRMVKPLAREQVRLTKRIRTGGIPPEGAGAPDPDEQEAMVDAPLESLLKKLVKQTGKKPAPVIVTPRPSKMKMEPATPGPSGIKMSKPTPIKTPPTSTGKKKSGGFKKAALSGAAKGFLKSLGVDPKFVDDDDDEDESPQAAKGKQPKKIKKTETERLAEGWEEWDKPTKRKLSYGKGKGKGKRKK